MLWFVVSLLSILFAFWGDEYGPFAKSPIYKLIFRVLLVITLSYITGLGGSISSDHAAYIWHYDNEYSIDTLSSLANSFRINLMGERDGFEPLFVGLGIICNKLGLTHVGFFLIVAIITNTLLVSVIFRFRLPYLSILLFLVSIDYYQEVNLVRQILAVSVFNFSLKFFTERRLILSALFVLIATFIHMSAILLMPLLLIPLLKDKGNKYIYVFLFLFWVLSVMVSMGMISLNFGALNAFTYYETVLNHITNISFDIIYNAMVIVFFVVMVMEQKSIIKRGYTIYAVVFILGCIFRNLAVSLFGLYRFSFYFSFIYCCFVPNYFSRSSLFADRKSGITIPVALLAIYYGYILLAHYIIREPSNGLGSVMYSLSDII